MPVVLFGKRKFRHLLTAIASTVLVFVTFTDFYWLFVQEELEADVMLKFLDDVVEDGSQAILAFFAFFNDTGVHVSVVM